MANQTDFTRPTGTAGTPVDPTGPGGVLIDLALEVAGILAASSIDPAIATDAEVAALLLGKQNTSEKGAVNGYAGLDGSTTVPDAQIPSGIARDSEVTTEIATHTGLAGAHHARYADSEADARVAVHSNLVGEDNPHKVVDYVTGVISGAALSINADPAKFDVAVGAGLLIDVSVPAIPVFTSVAISARAAVVDSFPGSSVTYLLVNAADTLVQQATFPSPAQRRTLVFLGSIVKSGGVIVVVVNGPVPGYGMLKTVEDVLIALGGISATNVAVTANSDLTLDTSSGTVISIGRGLASDLTQPNTIDRVAQTPVPAGLFLRVFEDGSGDLVVDASSNSLDPEQFNNVGVLAPVPALEFTIQRVFASPDTGAIQVYYGNTTYATLAAAIADRTTENWQEQKDTRGAAFRAHIVIQQGVTDLVAAVIAEKAAIITAGAVRPAVAQGTEFQPAAIFAQLSDSTTQKPGVTTPVVVTMDTDDSISGLEHSRPEDVKILTAGVYAFVFQPQVERTGSGADVAFHAWARKGRRDGTVSAVVDGSPTTITAVDHRIQTGQTVTLAGLSTTPDINGAHVVTVVDADTFTIVVVTSAVADGVGTWTRQLDVSDDVPNTNVELALQNVQQDDVIPIFLNIRLAEEDVVQLMQSVSDSTKGAGLVAKTPSGEPVIPSIILAINKVGDQ